MDSVQSHRQSGCIVVAVEPRQSDVVLLQAAALARDLGVDLLCAHVDMGRYPVKEHSDGSVASRPYDPDLSDLGDEDFEPVLADHIRLVLKSAAVRFELRALAGDPARALGHLAEAVNARLIVVGTHNPGIRRGLHEFFNGSVAVHLAHRQHRPVLVIPLSPVTDEDKLPWE